MSRVSLSTALISVFIAVFGLAGIRDYMNPALYWVLGCLPLLILGIMEIRARGVRNLLSTVTDNPLVKKSGAFWLVFIAGIAIAGAANDGVGFMAVFKYLALGFVFIALSSFLINKEQVLAGLKLWAAVGISGAVGLLLFDVKDLLILTPGRIGWVWAWPGVLWKAGLFLLVWLVWQLIMGPLRTVNLVWLFVTALIIGLDGSRTGIVITAGGFAVFLLLALIRYKSDLLRVAGRAMTVALFISVGMGMVNPSPWNPVRVVHQHLNGVFLGGGVDPVVQNATESSGRDITEDSIRIRMLSAAVEGSIANFPVGSGFGSTGVPVEGVEGAMVVHITYLQLLSDVGVIGLLGYLGIFAVPLFAAYRRVVRAESRWLALDQCSLPLSILMCFLVSGLLHPVSSELSEWAIVLLALCLLIRELPTNEQERKVMSSG